MADFSRAYGVQVGDHNVQHNYFTQRRPVSWPCRVGVVPPPATGRQPRPADRDLAGAGEAVVVTGLGGVGKTQLAVNLAEQLWSEGAVDLLIWVTATTRAGVLSTCAIAAGEVTGTDDPDPEQAANRLLSWLAGTDRRWLVVLDDVADPADLTGLWPPATDRGRTVITTRRRDAALLTGRRLVDVGVFTPGQATAYLTGLLGGDPVRLAEADHVAADLGHLPLALAQAAAYILDQDITCAAYRSRLAHQPLTALHPGTLPDQQSVPVARAWALSVAAAGGLAQAVLRMAALLDPNGIPVEVFTARAALTYYRWRAGSDDVHGALRTLHRLGLAEVDAGTVRIHALVQRTARETTAEPDRHPLAIVTADAMTEVWPRVERDAATGLLGQRLRANTYALTVNAGALLWRSRDGHAVAHEVLFRCGYSYGDTGLVALAHRYFADMYAYTLRHFGPDHRDTVSAGLGLAEWQGHAGDPTGAAAVLEGLMAGATRVHGPGHSQTLVIRHNIAYWRGEAGDRAGAVAAFEDLLGEYLRRYGPEHPDVLKTRHNVVVTRGWQEDPAGAVAALERSVADFTRVHGPDHRHTLTARGILARWRGETGDPAAAVTGLEQLLADRLRLLGPDHPDTLTARGQVAQWKGMAGDPATAVAALEQLLTDRLRVLGPGHPDTTYTRASLDEWRRRAGS
ncbi:tetratricopeptide repeat protein [Actinoplanes sp. NPDC051861]|uniref:tetratricopeptide repeat protein n=1 Tax=Actinoplanes sp. NPDC051861 TaxID=3155170 RepID=UPI00343090AC